MALVHTAEETAEIIGGDCKPSWLREKARKREIPFTMIGARYGWTDRHIEEILALAEHRPEPAAAQRRVAARPQASGPSAPVVMLTARTPRRRQPAA